MFVNRNGNEMTMTDSLLCINYSDMNHLGSSRFERVGDNEYKCKNCDAVMTVKEPVLVLDEKSRLKMQVSAEYK
jgi:hypothetical protein